MNKKIDQSEFIKMSKEDKGKFYAQGGTVTLNNKNTIKIDKKGEYWIDSNNKKHLIDNGCSKGDGVSGGWAGVELDLNKFDYYVKIGGKMTTDSDWVKEWVTYAEIVGEFNISRQMLQDWCSKGLVNYFRLPSGHRRYNINDVKEIFEKALKDSKKVNRKEDKHV